MSEMLNPNLAEIEKSHAFDDLEKLLADIEGPNTVVEELPKELQLRMLKQIDLANKKIDDSIANKTEFPKNYFTDGESINKYFTDKKNFNKIIHTLIINNEQENHRALVRELFDYLVEKEVYDEDKEFEFTEMFREVVRDTRHSIDYKNSRFVVILTAKQNNVKINVLNPDNIPCSQHKHTSIAEAAKNNDYTSNKESYGVGSTMIKRLAEELGGECYYADVNDSEDKKQYTLFHFEQK